MVFKTREFFEALAEYNKWGFSYGTKAHHNIYDVTGAIDEAITAAENEEEPKEIVLYCREVNQDTHKNIITFELILAKKSDFQDANYAKRDEEIIEPMKQLLQEKVHDAHECSTFEFSKFMMYDVSDEFDSNVDGVLTNATAEFFI